MQIDLSAILIFFISFALRYWIFFNSRVWMCLPDTHLPSFNLVYVIERIVHNFFLCFPQNYNRGTWINEHFHSSFSITSFETFSLLLFSIVYLTNPN